MSDAVKVPEVLYHYCSLETFCNIIKNKSIWLSDFRKTNDKKELIWLRTTVEKELYSCIQTKMSSCKIGESLGWELVRQLIEHAGAELGCWGFCLSEKPDNLGQWRGYGDDGRGVSIGFKQAELKDIIQPVADDREQDIDIEKPDLKFGKVNYGENIFGELSTKAEMNIEERREGIQKLANESISMYGHDTDAFPEINISQEMAKVVIIEWLAMRRGPFYKMQAFIEEAEHRIVFSMPENRTATEETFRAAFATALKKNGVDGQWDESKAKIQFEEYGYSVRNNDLVSHLAIGFENLSDVIASVTIGPKSKATKEDIELFLKLNGVYNDSIKIKKSAASYR